MKGPGFERDGARTTLVDGAEVEAHPDHVNIIWYMPVELLRLSYKTERPLRSAGLVLVGDLVQRRLSDLLELPRFTPAALDEVAVAFETHDLRPDTLVQGFAPENPHLVKRIRYATEVVRSIIWWQRRRIETEWSAAWQHFDQLEPLTKEDERLHTKVKDLQLRSLLTGGLGRQWIRSGPACWSGC